MGMRIKRIEVDFAIEVDVTSDQAMAIANIIQDIARSNQPEGMVHWQSGGGSKPQWSKADQRFLGIREDPDAPDNGEPTFDDSIYYLETTCREDYNTEKCPSCDGGDTDCRDCWGQGKVSPRKLEQINKRSSHE